VTIYSSPRPVSVGLPEAHRIPTNPRVQPVEHLHASQRAGIASPIQQVASDPAAFSETSQQYAGG
jgi:hypothetical protein